MSTETLTYHKLVEIQQRLAVPSRAEVAVRIYQGFAAAGEIVRIDDDGLAEYADIAVRAADAVIARLVQEGEGGGS